MAKCPFPVFNLIAMDKIYISKLKTTVLNNEENRELLTKYGLINDVENNQGATKHARVNVVRVGKRKSTK